MLAKITARDFDLEKTLSSGQVFHWEKHGKGFVGTIGDSALYTEQRDERLLFSGVQREVIADYFALDHPLEKICRSFPRDLVMDEARDFCRGLRIIRQPKWECLATFICSSMKQVAHIRQISRALRTRFRRTKDDRRNCRLHFSERDAAGANERTRTARVRTRVSRQKFAVDGAAGRSRRSEPRGLVRAAG